jgi:glycerol uptake facilitator-like aquaporin
VSKLVPAVLGEFVGTALLLAAIVGSGTMGERMAAGNDGIALLANSLATGCALFVLVLVFAPVSGAHFNPLVSLLARLEGDVTTPALLLLAATQVIAAFAGVALAHGMFDLALWAPSLKQRTGFGQWLAEGVATFGLVLAIMGSRRHGTVAVAAAVAAYICAAYWFTASTSFANPAVTLARAFTPTFAGIAPGHVAAFVAAQCVGAMAAYAMARFLGLDKQPPG